MSGISRVDSRYRKGGRRKVLSALVEWLGLKGMQQLYERRQRVHCLFRITGVALHARHRQIDRDRAASTDLDGITDGFQAGWLSDKEVISL